MHLLILPFLISGLTAKIFNNKLKNKSLNSTNKINELVTNTTDSGKRNEFKQITEGNK
jgi:hypothetical protein